MAKIISPVEIAKYAWDAGFRGADLVRAVSVAIAESSGDPTNRNTHGGNDARGLMQINIAPQANPKFASRNLYDPAVNMKTAKELFEERKAAGLDPWGPWNSSKAGQFLSRAIAESAVTAFNLKNPGEVASDTVDSAKDAIGDATGLGGVVDALDKAGSWASTPKNWLRVAYVATGFGLVIGGLIVLSRPITEPIISTGAKVAGFAKGA